MDNTLLNLINADQRQIWCGNKRPFSMDCINLLLCSNFRVSSALHHRYDVVWYLEKDFNEIGDYSWKLALDEMIRMIGEKGRIVLRIKRGISPGLANIKSFLWRRAGIDCRIEYEADSPISNSIIIVVYVNRKNIEIYKKDDWTFIILTMGDKKENVVAFLKSIRKYECKRSEIIVVGPENKEYEPYDIRYVDWEKFRYSPYAEISRKKNEALEMAQNTNVCIVHDRYVLDEDYFTGFESYGYDFDYLTVSQRTKDGSSFPALMACAGYPSDLNPQSYRTDNTQIIYPMSYVNGGLIIAKKEVIRGIGFNDMLFWGQMEDVELARCFEEQSLPPRINFLSHATTLEVRDGSVKNADDYNLMLVGEKIPSEKRQERELEDTIRVISQLFDFFPRDELLDKTIGFGLNAIRDMNRSLELYLFGLLYVLQNNMHIVIYGAGVFGKRLMKYCLRNCLEDHIDGFIVTGSPDSNIEAESGKPIYSISSGYFDRDNLVLVAANEKFVPDMMHNLDKHHYQRFRVIDRTLMNLIRRELEIE